MDFSLKIFYKQIKDISYFWGGNSQIFVDMVELK